VGAFYFPGWSQPDRWYCVRANPATLHPLMGYYREGDPGVADWHIRWALESGVSFFAFDYYCFRGSEMLEAALADGFLRSQHIDQFRFCLNWCNHQPAETQDAQELRLFGDVVINKYLRHPSYLRIDGRPVVMILAGYSFVKTLGVERAKAAFDALKQRCSEAGLGGMYLVFGEGEIVSEEGVRQSIDAGVDSFFLYNYPYAGSGISRPGTHGEAPYADLAQQGEGLWKHWSGLTKGAFWPTVMAGWDRRPWTKDLDLVRTGFTPDLFAEQLRNAKQHTGRDDIVLIEAWNEWGEGSVLEPSQELGFACLDQVREVFGGGDAAPRHEPTAPAATDIVLPAIDSWRFDHGPEGWTPANTTPVTHSWGAISVTSTGSDALLNSPATYLAAEAYDALVVRMRVTPAQGEPGVTTGQLFWSTVDRAICEDLSIGFEVSTDGEWHEYVLPVAGSPEWKSTIDRFRLDPVAASDLSVDIDRVEVRRRAV